MPTKTRDALQLLRVSPSRLRWAITSGKFAPPAKDASGDYCWLPEDIERARQALATDRRKTRHARREEVTA